METTTNDLLQVLEAERTKLMLNQGEFSNFLGISESYYSMLKTGDRRPTLNFLTLVMQKLPHLTPEVTIFMIRRRNNPGAEENSIKTGVQNPGGIHSTMAGGSNPPNNLAKTATQSK